MRTGWINALKLLSIVRCKYLINVSGSQLSLVRPSLFLLVIKTQGLRKEPFVQLRVAGAAFRSLTPVTLLVGACGVVTLLSKDPKPKACRESCPVGGGGQSVAQP